MRVISKNSTFLLQFLKAAGAKRWETDSTKKPEVQEPEILAPLPGPSDVVEEHPLVEYMPPPKLGEKVQEPGVRGANQCTRCSQNSRKVENTMKKNRRLLKNIPNLKQQNVCLFYYT